MEDEAFQKKMTDQGLAPFYKGADDYAAYWDETTQVFTDLLPQVQEEE